jgi:CRISPR-associated protein Cmr4
MFEKAVIFGLYSITPVHAGSGAELSVIDLPIQRERHTGFPMIWGQSLKGVLRRAYEKLSKNKGNTEIIFGPPTDRAHEHAGAISVGDAKILLFPVRSLKGVFAYVTCPLVLERLKRDLEFLGVANDFEVPPVNEDRAVVSENSSIKINQKEIVIEDIVLNVEGDDEYISSLTKTISMISPISIDKSKIAVVHNDVFTNFVQTATEVVARLRIKSETGTVDSGALWYEEYLPSDTLLYSVIAVGKPKRTIDGLSTAKDIVKELMSFGGKFVQVGGNETVGKGFVKLKVMTHEGSGARKG